MKLQQMLEQMVAIDASDLFLVTGAKAAMKINGEIKHITDSSLELGQVREMAYGLLDEEKIKRFEQFPECNLAHSISGLGRFRVNIYQTRNEVGMVIRNIKTEIPDMESLSLPPILKDLVMKKRGLILFVGATGTGKSTSLASMIDYRNANSASHIITIEDPMEFIYSHKQSIVTQREVGIDTDSYHEALKNTLRQAPDVILIGEIRDRETMEHAVAFSETGHLCLSTLHANNANQALERIINFFPDERRDQVLLDLSLNLVGIISQRLIRKSEEEARVPAFEILLGTPLVRDLIKRHEIHQLRETMEKSTHIGMQTFDSCLIKLYEEGKISFDEALRNADSSNNVRLAIQLKEKANGRFGEDDHLTMERRPDDDELPPHF
jgi:twitching motility protein PilU